MRTPSADSRQLPRDLLITKELATRPRRSTNLLAEIRAMHDLVRQTATQSDGLLDRLAELAVDLCDAGSAGVSLLEKTPEGETVFRWVALAGAFAPYVGGSTPRNHSPCGICLERNEPILLARPYRVFEYFNKASPAIVEGLVLPLYGESGRPLGTIWIVSHEEGYGFDQGTVETMIRLADFTALALRMTESVAEKERLLRWAEQEITKRERAEGLKGAQRRALELAVTNAPLAEVLETLVRTIEQHSRSEMLGSILLLDSDGVHLRHGAALSLAEEYNSAIDGIAIGPNAGSCGTAAFTKKPVYVSDIPTDPRWADFRDLANAHGLRACWSTPIASASGNVLGTFAMYYREPREPTVADLELVEVATRTAALIIERKQAEKALRDSEQRFRAFTMASSDVVYRVNEDWSEMRYLDGRDFIADTPEPSRAWLENYIYPEDQPQVMATINEAVRTKSMFELEHRVRRADGTIGWTFSRAIPIVDSEGEIVEWFGAASDVTERKRAEEHRTLLINELNHRVKNTLATVQAIAAQTFRETDLDSKVRSKFDDRLVALSKAHSILTQQNWEGADIREVMAQTLQPHAGPDRFRIQGPPIRLTPKAALTLSMALHELATNAVKYGALSNGTGRVNINWTTEAVTQGFRLRWMESDGPAVSPPERRGFGSRLIEHGLAQDLGGEVRLDFDKQGIVCTIQAPLEEVRRDVNSDGREPLAKMAAHGD
ncbi:MAG TPA: GAF domain-containing protein [Pseudolabrys sp.]|jgi:two-component sensor histidine kinase|nr:GAF domain-containing protein [Pseudolabrys sp.]